MESVGLFFSRVNSIFEGLNMLKLAKLCTGIRTGKNFASALTLWVSELVINGKFHVCARNLVQVCNILIPTKSILESSLKRNRKSDIFNFFYDFCAVFAIFRPHTLTNSSYSFNWIIFKFGEWNHNSFAMLNCKDLAFSLKDVSMATWQISILNTCPYSVVVIVPAAKRKRHVLRCNKLLLEIKMT